MGSYLEIQVQTMERAETVEARVGELEADLERREP